MFGVPKQDEKAARDAGRDCALNGANTTNCHFSLFSSPELTRAWEEGKKQAERELTPNVELTVAIATAQEQETDDPLEGHAQNCNAVKPGDRECSCHQAYGFPTAEAMDESDDLDRQQRKS